MQRDKIVKLRFHSVYIYIVQKRPHIVLRHREQSKYKIQKCQKVGNILAKLN